jgi:nucleoside phosphorylase
VILCALPVEYRAVRRHLDDPRPYGDPNEVNWERGRFIGTHAEWDVVIVETGPENAPAAVETERLLSAVAPQVSMYVGVAGGLGDAKGVKAGEVIVPRRVFHYGAGKDSKVSGERPRGESVSRRLLLAAQRVARDRAWQGRVPDDAGGDVRVRFEPIASGDRLVKSVDSGVHELLRQHAEDAVAVDMESGGFLHAAQQHEYTRALVVRGISDLLTDKRPDDDQTRQPTAAERAAAFAYAVLSDTRPDEPSVDGPAPGASLDLPRQLAELAGLERWLQITEGLFQPTPHIDIEDSERFEVLQGWLAAHVPAEPTSEVTASAANFARVLRDLELVLNHVMHVRLHQYWVHEWYRNYHGSAQYDAEVQNFRNHVSLIWNLAAELTRALNLVRDRARVIDPGLLAETGAATTFTGPNHEPVLCPRYGAREAAQSQPYPGLQGFPEVLPTREDGSFGVGHHDEAPTPGQLRSWIETLEAEHGPGSPPPRA